MTTGVHHAPTPLSALSFAPAALRGMDPGMDKFPVRYLPSQKVWEVDVRPHGRIRSVLFPGSDSPMKLVDRKMADEVRRNILRDLAKGIPERTAVSPYLPRESLLERWAERWLEALERQVAAGERSPTYTRRLRDFVKRDWSPLYGQSIHTVGLLQLEDFAHALREDHGATTVWHIMSALRTCLRWVAKRSGGTYHAPDFPELRRGAFEPRVLEPEQQAAVLEQIDVAQRGVFLALADLMIRPGEARALDVGDYDFRAHELEVGHAIQGSRKDARRGPTKGRDRRLLLASDRLAAWLEERVSAEQRLRGGPLFANPLARGDDPRWPESTLRHVWEAAAERAGFKCGLYVGTKHSTSTWLRRAGLSLDELGLAMGHRWATREKQVTAGYARPPRLANANVVRLIDSRGR